MKEVDYIIVGLGIAGLSFCEQLEKHGKSFVVFDGQQPSATQVSGGVFNPVVLKRFTIAWNAKEHLEESLPFYEHLSQKLNIPIFSQEPIYRILTSVEEQNDWAVASDKFELSPYLSAEIDANTNASVVAPFGFGKVRNSGRIFPSEVLSAYREYLQKKDSLSAETFDYDQLSEENNTIHYKNLSAKKIVFAEGVLVTNNPFFPKEYLSPNKGEFLLIKAPELKLPFLLKGPVYIIPLGEDLYKVGATYSRDDLGYAATQKAEDEIVSKLKKMVSCPFTIVSQEIGIRPTTKDRRPLMGMLSESKNKVFFNGLGTHGIMGAPLLSKMLYEHVAMQIELPKEVDINRWS